MAFTFVKPAAAGILLRGNNGTPLVTYATGSSLRKTVLFQNFARKAKIFLGGGTGRFFQNLLLRHAFLHKIGFHGRASECLAGTLSASHNNNGIRFSR